MDFAPYTLLALAVTAPIIVGLILLAGRDLPRSFTSGFAFGGFAIPAVLAPWLLVLWTNEQISADQFRSAGFWGFGFGLNGLGAPLLAMTSLVGFAAGVKALNQEVEGRNTYLGLILFMLGGTLGVFGTNHLVGFYFFHEFALIPTFILTLFWGGEGRRPAAMQMAIFLTAGAMASLAGILIAVDVAGVEYGAATFENVAQGLQNAKHIPAAVGALVLFGLGTLASLFPFHSWAAPGYSAAPTPVSMLHAGALKKFGLYGIILLGLSSLDITGGSLGAWFLWFAVANVVLVGLICLAQRDLKQLLSWSSVAHMGPIFLGIWVCGVTGQADGLDAAAFLMVAHGVGEEEERTASPAPRSSSSPTPCAPAPARIVSTNSAASPPARRSSPRSSSPRPWPPSASPASATSGAKSASSSPCAPSPCGCRPSSPRPS
jgi:NADH-quinone oxidoreductase subunit M